jgi:hypothetical protein
MDIFAMGQLLHCGMTRTTQAWFVMADGLVKRKQG